MSRTKRSRRDIVRQLILMSLGDYKPHVLQYHEILRYLRLGDLRFGACTEDEFQGDIREFSASIHLAYEDMLGDILDAGLKHLDLWAEDACFGAENKEDE